MVRDLKVSVVGGGGEDGGDRISNLPEQIIHDILNRMKSPDAAARTSVLSRRWLQLWLGYPFFGFPLSKSNESRFRSFVASSCRKLLPPQPQPSDSDHSISSCFTGVGTVQDFSISLRQDRLGNEDLDMLLLFITDNASVLSPVNFELYIRDTELVHRYRLPVPNWSGTKSVTLSGCSLTSATAASASLGSIESLRLENVTLSEQLLHSLLANALRLTSLNLRRIFGIGKLDVVSSPLLQRLCLSDIYYICGRRSCIKEMRRLRISSPTLETLSLCSGLKKLEIDAPNLVSLSWTVYSGDPSTKVNVINLGSNCPCTVHVLSYAGLNPQWLRLFLSTKLTLFHQLNLVSSFRFWSSEQRDLLDLTHDEYAFLPPTIDQVQYEPFWWDTRDIEKAATFLDRLFWVCRPKFMSIVNCNVSLVAERMCQEYLKIDCPHGVNSATSWSQHLIDMKIENDVTGEMMEISEDVIPSLAKRVKVKFMLIWF